MDPTPVSVVDLARALERLPAEGFTPEGVTGLLQPVRVDPASLAPYLLFDAARYTRNLVYECSRFELLALCWEPGQKSAIHNHAGQQCWMLVPVGRLINQNYRLLELDEARHRCRLEPASQFVIDPDHPAHVDPAEPIHRVENPASDGCRAVSIHLYSLPYDRCLVYSLENNRYGEVELQYTTRFGMRDPA
jgi:cysteine dioxygenase